MIRWKTEQWGLEHSLGAISSCGSCCTTWLDHWGLLLRVFCCSAGGASAGFPHPWTCFPGPWDHPAVGDSPGTSPAESCSHNLLPEEHASCNPQVPPESRVLTGKAYEEARPKVVTWSLVAQRCEEEEQLPVWAQLFAGDKHLWARSFQCLARSFSFSSPRN